MATIPDKLLASSAAHSRRANQESGNTAAADRNKQRTDYYTERASAEDPNSVEAPPAILQDRKLNQTPIVTKNRERQAPQRTQAQSTSTSDDRTYWEKIHDVIFGTNDDGEMDENTTVKIKSAFNTPSDNTTEQGYNYYQQDKQRQPPHQQVPEETAEDTSTNDKLNNQLAVTKRKYENAHQWGNSSVDSDLELLHAPREMAESAVQTSAVSKDAYESFFANEEQENEGNEEYQAMKVDSGNLVTEANKNSVDDGTPTLEARTSDTMPGWRYKQYVEATGTGRPIEEIDDNRAYSKINEMEMYGFQPYIPDEAAYNRMKTQASSKNLSDMFNLVANARTELADYNVNYNGQNYSGKELDSKLPAYLQSQKSNFDNNGGNSQIFNTKEEAGESAIPVKVTRTYSINGVPYTVDSLSSFEFEELPDKTVVKFPDTGEQIELPNIDGDYTVSHKDNYDMVDDPSEANAWLGNTGINDLVLSDGSRISYLDAVALANGAGDRDYGIFGKPSSVMASEDDILGNLLPYTIDLVLGSAPLMNPATAWMQGIANAGSAAAGYDARSFTPTLAHENPTDNEYLWNIVGNAIQPAAERLAGNIGGKALFGSEGILGSITDRVARRLGERTWAPAARMLEDIGGEALEEIFPGQVVEDLIANGSDNLFANTMTDESGENVYDKTGHEVRDPNTPFWDRIQNYVGGMGENAASGAWLSALLGAPRIPHTVAQTKAVKAYNKAAKESNLEPLKTPKKNKQNLWNDLDDDLVSWYDEEEVNG